MIASVTSTGTTTLAGARADRRRAAVGQAEPLGVVGVHVHRAAILAADEVRQVVHPRVVRAQVAATDQDQSRRRSRSIAAASRSRSASSAGGASSTLPLGVRSTPGAAAASGRDRRRAGAVRARRASVPSSPRPARRRRPGAVGAAAEHQVEDALRPAPLPEPGQNVGRIHALGRRAGGRPSPRRATSRATMSSIRRRRRRPRRRRRGRRGAASSPLRLDGRIRGSTGGVKLAMLRTESW